jgi:acyl-CoA synthetase (AMP-forming)/AMP-acid ligase II
MPENRVGTVAISSVSLFGGYRNNPEKTHRVLKDGWYVTGDRGFLHHGEYYIIGRGDDVIVFAGRNIFPEDIEHVVNKVKGVIPGRVVAFGIDDPKTGTEDVCVVVETELEEKEKREGLILAIKQAGMGIDVTLDKVYLAPPRSLIKSSSGKISRKMNRERIVSANIAAKEGS